MTKLIKQSNGLRLLICDLEFNKEFLVNARLTSHITIVVSREF